MRRKPGAHLSREGIALARQVGAASGSFDLVVTSTIPRAIETAIAMGFAVDRTVEAFGVLTDGVEREVSWPSDFAAVAAAVRHGGAAQRFAAEQAQLWQDLVTGLPEGGRLLIISHGHIVDLGAVGSLPDADHAGWGGPIGYCEGVRVEYDGAQRRGGLLRVSDADRLVEN